MKKWALHQIFLFYTKILYLSEFDKRLEASFLLQWQDKQPISSYTQKATISQLGVAGVIAKPFDPMTLNKEVSEILGFTTGGNHKKVNYWRLELLLPKGAYPNVVLN